MDDPDDLRDADLRAVLRRHAEQIAGPIDTDVALGAVRRRIRARRRRLVATSTIAAAAAVTVAVVAAGVLDEDGRSLRTPAAPAASVDATPATPPPIPTPATVAATTTVPTTTTVPATTAPPTPATVPAAAVPVAPAAPVTPPAATVPPDTGAAPSTTAYSSAGGSIVVRRDGGAIALDGDPSPSPGWTAEIDDDGPTRVRVRFERDGERTEIRVDLEDDRLVPRITGP